MNKITLTEFANNEWREFSLYTIEERAIPSMIDGFKPVHRFIMHSALKCANKSTAKVTAIAGAVAEYGYHHGETNAQGATQLMAASWCNNQPLLLGDGNFGDRLVPEGGAARYVYAQIHPRFHQIYQDLDMCPEHVDDEHIPPRYYLPIIPMVLVNGIKGIATGYATDILPHDIKQVTDLCIKHVKGQDISQELMVPKFYEFSGTLVANPKGGWDQTGKITLVGKTTAVISELPFKYDRESYIEVLDALEAADIILRYEDECDIDGFKFRVDLKRGFDTKSNEELVKIFSLNSSVTQNLTVLDQDRKLRKYSTPNELIKDFCDFRLPFYSDRIAKRLAESEHNFKVAVAKIKFIGMILNQQLDFKGKTKAALTKELTATFEKDIVPSLLGMEFYSLTKDEIVVQMGKAKALDAKRAYWKNATPAGLFIEDLEQI